MDEGFTRKLVLISAPAGFGKTTLIADWIHRWYRYHHLFADLLQQRLHIDQGDRVPELHRRASRWCAQNGFKNEAVDHALIARDNAHAAQLMEEIAELDWDRARESRLLRAKALL